MFGIAARGIPSFGDLAWHKPVQDVAYSALSPTILSPGTGISFAQSLNKSTNGPLSAEPIASAGGLNIGDRLLVTSEASPKNGIWTIFDLGSATSKWILIRATDMDSAAEAPVGSVTYDLSLGGLWVAVGGGTGAWTLAPNQVGSLFMGLASGAPDIEIHRSGTKALTIDDGLGGPLTITLPNSGSTTPTIAGGGTATFANQSCRWLRLGHWVMFAIRFDVTAVGSGATAVTLTGTGLPPATPASPTAFLGYRSLATPTPILWLAANGGSPSELQITPGITLPGTPTTPITGAGLANTARYVVNGSYEA